MSWDTVKDETVSKSNFKPSEYQQGIFDWVEEKIGIRNNLVVQAVAGSGKSTTGIEMFGRLPEDLDPVFVAFNNHIAKELKSRLPDGANARTYHSLGLATLKRTFPKVRVDEDKVEKFIRSRKVDGWMMPSTKRLVSLCKGGLDINFTNDDLNHIAFDHDIDLYDEKNDSAKINIFNLVRYALDHSVNNPDVVDFDDMIWLTNVRDDIEYYQHGFLFVDEVQDTNQGQMLLAMNSVKDDGMIVGVGDRFQSLYHFRGADATAMDKLKTALNADELPLSISYRCPTEIRDLVNKKFPHIKFEVPEWAIKGVVRDSNALLVENELVEGDMVLCRVNADLVPMAFALIRKGVKATIRGRDIGKGLLSLIKKSHATDTADLVGWMNRWKEKEIMKAIRIGADDKIQYITDRFETLYAMTEGCDTVTQVAERCATMFSDDRAGVVLSSIHRAKGLESNRVFILRPDLLPHPAAKSAVDKQTEENCVYVAITRAKEELVFVR